MNDDLNVRWQTRIAVVLMVERLGGQCVTDRSAGRAICHCPGSLRDVNALHSGQPVTWGAQPFIEVIKRLEDIRALTLDN